MRYSVPARFAEQDAPLDNFSDQAIRQKVLKNGINSEDLDFEIKLTVNLNTIDDLVCAAEQDYYLAKILMPKMHYLIKDNSQLEQAYKCVNRYLSASHIQSDNAEKIRKQSLSRLNLL